MSTPRHVPRSPLSNVTTTSDVSLQAFVDEANRHIDKIWASHGAIGPSFFQALAVRLSHNNITVPKGRVHGGPFGAIIVQYAGGVKDGVGIGKPRVVGVGANQVVPQNDPTAHAEMIAYRDAAKRLGKTDFSDCALFTSCACCPMCLGIGNGTGLGAIHYVNTPEQARIAGFADDLQYQHFHLPRERQMRHIETMDMPRQQRLLAALGDHGAVVIDKDYQVIGTGENLTRQDPTMVPSLAAVRDATKKLKSFFLPEGSTLVCRDMPHPSGFVGADWVRILRERNPDMPGDPEQDDTVINPDRLVYVHQRYETIHASDGHGHWRIAQPTDVTYQQPILGDAERAIPTKRHMSSLDPQKHPHNVIRLIANNVFDNWRMQTAEGTAIKY